MKENINKIDIESKPYMAHAEKKCRKIKSGKIPFSPDSILWIKRRKTYRTLMGYHAGNKINKGNLEQAARRDSNAVINSEDTQEAESMQRKIQVL